MSRPFIHPTVTLTRVIDACNRQMHTLDNPGFCLACGDEQGECEPDAQRYECEACGAEQVYGASEVLIAGYYHDDTTPAQYRRALFVR